MYGRRDPVGVIIGGNIDRLSIIYFSQIKYR